MVMHASPMRSTGLAAAKPVPVSAQDFTQRDEAHTITLDQRTAFQHFNQTVSPGSTAQYARALISVDDCPAILQTSAQILTSVTSLWPDKPCRHLKLQGFNLFYALAAHEVGPCQQSKSHQGRCRI